MPLTRPQTTNMTVNVRGITDMPADMTSHHWQGIVTKYLGPTNHRGARVVA